MIPSDIKSKIYIDHIVLTISDIERTKDFYSKIFGEPDYVTSNSIMYFVERTRLFFGLPNGTPFANDKFDANRVGLDHLAIGVKTLNELNEIQKTLDKNSIIHSGIHADKHSGKEKIWLNDPDGIRLEFFLRQK